MNAPTVLGLGRRGDRKAAGSGEAALGPWLDSGLPAWWVVEEGPVFTCGCWLLCPGQHGLYAELVTAQEASPGGQDAAQLSTPLGWALEDLSLFPGCWLGALSAEEAGARQAREGV